SSSRDSSSAAASSTESAFPCSARARARRMWPEPSLIGRESTAAEREEQTRARPISGAGDPTRHRMVAEAMRRHDGVVRVAALAGGIGAGKFLRGLTQVVRPEDVSVVVNTGDDVRMHGLLVSPDLES